MVRDKLLVQILSSDHNKYLVLEILYRNMVGLAMMNRTRLFQTPNHLRLVCILYNSFFQLRHRKIEILDLKNI
ncbi:hypothetical protein D1AOALGA4SA_4210 [Olavius algarvensis Delta 1 endosymbiont]|nr:hypothetical protein D1AOALGA4SA_4210 [Olavius algarvensis Delta 1 endosymbiont]